MGLGLGIQSNEQTKNVSFFKSVRAAVSADSANTVKKAITDTSDDLDPTSNIKRVDERTSESLNDGGRDPMVQMRADVVKYWNQRYQLFHRFDEGIRLDVEGWYSVTPEKIARQIATRFKGKTVVADFFSGPGGNCIQFALNGSIVIGIENSAERIEMALNNADVYGVRHLMEFIHGDVFEIVPKLRKKACAIEAVFMSPPWGGPEYLSQDVYDVSRFKPSVDCARIITNNIAVLVPRNVKYDDVIRVFGACEVEKNRLGNKLKTQTLYFGNLISGAARQKLSSKLDGRQSSYI